MGASSSEAYGFKGCVNPTVVNNTVDMLDVTHAFFIQQVFGYDFNACTGVVFRNNLATRLYSNGFPQPLAQGVMGISTTFTAGFCDVWDIGPGKRKSLLWWGNSR